MRKTFGWFIFVLVALLGGLFGGCQRQPAGTQPGTTTGGQQVIRWTMATSWPSGILLQDMARKFAEEVKVASGGRLVIDVQPGGAIVGPLEVLDAANAGTIDAYHSVSTYWMGKAPAASLFTSVPMGFEPFMYLTWIYEYGGLDLWQKTYDQAGFKIKVLPLGITHPEMLAHSHVALNKLDDFKGLKHRTAAEFADIFKSMGVSVVTVPGAEVYPALERKVIDSAEFSTPAVNKQLAFHEITKYYVGPGMHQPACLFELGINKTSWDKLPEDLKQVVQIAARSVTLWAWTRDFAESVKAIEHFESKGNVGVRVSDEVQREFRKAAWDYLDKKAQTDQMYATVWNSMKEYWQKHTKYETFMVPIRK